MDAPSQNVFHHLPLVGLYASTWIVGGTFLKRYSETGLPTDFAISIAASALGASIAIPLLKAAGIGMTMALTSALYIIAMAMIGIVAFGEKLSPVQIVGLGFACVATILMALPSRSNTEGVDSQASEVAVSGEKIRAVGD
ncbi:MAG: hypothetical protein KDH88_19665 [Chromatiales bacterium]|nr:hypothetical protein [Chromatiales bacterium]